VGDFGAVQIGEHAIGAAKPEGTGKSFTSGAKR